jgi:hypothetical protein
MATAKTSKRITSVSIRQNAKKDHSPNWDNTETLTGEQFTHKWHVAMNWYRLECTDKTLKPKVIDWMGRAGYDKSVIQAFKKTKDNRCSQTVGAIAANLIKGMPPQRDDFNNGRNSEDWLRGEIAKIINEGKDDIDDSIEVVAKVVKPVVYVPTIQDRLREAAGDMSEELDAAIDSWITDPEAFDPKAFKVVNLLKGKGAKAAHSRLIKGYFQRGADELAELSSGNADDQLKEGYKHVSRKNVNKLIAFYESIATACEQIAAEQKVLKKPRAKKVKPAEDLVKKIKFMLTEPKLGITSVPPASIIGAQAAVVYNAKTRKIGMYIAKTSAGLSVKGTSITEFTEKSFQKTLRKPLEQLKEFKEQNTQRRVDVWFSNIKTTGVALNGRVSEDIVILKVFK